MARATAASGNEMKLTVFFEDPFWVGVFERTDGRKYAACKVTFGAEPTDAQIFAFVVRHFNHLSFSKPVKTTIRQTADNPKRRQREAKKLLRQKGTGTKSQQALQKQYEQNKILRKKEKTGRRKEESERLFSLKQEKKKQKHKGH